MTGDIGEFDEDGYLKIVDRKKELIITAAGKNLSPANIEARLKQVPLVSQAIAIGDKRKYISALLTLDPEAAKSWASEHGIDGDLAALAENEALIARGAEGAGRCQRGARPRGAGEALQGPARGTGSPAATS